MLRSRKIERLSLDFTDLVVDVDRLHSPQAAVRRLADPRGELVAALARRRDAQLVFHGLAHIPLTVLAGKLVTDRQPVLLFDYHPSATPPNWHWPDDTDYPQMRILREPRKRISRPGIVFVTVSVSYPVTAQHTSGIGLQPLAEIDLRVPQPERGIVRSQQQVLEYGRKFRRILDLISDKIPNCEAVHLFYAGPVALAFHIGQQISENIHPKVIVWNFRGRYEWAEVSRQ
ncbi:MAG: SAVED domain-containing protein [Desulfomonilaceae bacterium]